MVVMVTVTVSPKFQIVIPKEVREGLRIKAGEKLIVIQKGGLIHLAPVGPISRARGIAKGVETHGLREKRDRI